MNVYYVHVKFFFQIGCHEQLTLRYMLEMIFKRTTFIISTTLLNMLEENNVYTTMK